MILLLIAITTATAVEKHLDDSLKHAWFWETTPTIEICPDSNITTQKISKTLDYWKSRGVDVAIDKIEKVDHCDLDKRNVTQVMGNRDLRPTEHGRTNVKWYFYGHTKYDSTLYIKASRIQLPNEKLSNETIVLHEFGHALGLDHTNDKIMTAYH